MKRFYLILCFSFLCLHSGMTQSPPPPPTLGAGHGSTTNNQVESGGSAPITSGTWFLISFGVLYCVSKYKTIHHSSKT